MLCRLPLVCLLPRLLTAQPPPLISPYRLPTGPSLSLLYLPGPAPAPLCVSPGSAPTLPLLAHSACQAAGFPASASHALVPPPAGLVIANSTTNQVVECSQAVVGDYSVSCRLKPATPPSLSCSSLVSVTCSTCHTHLSLAPNTSLTIASPLYPVLQPGLLCDWLVTVTPPASCCGPAATRIH